MQVVKKTTAAPTTVAVASSRPSLSSSLDALGQAIGDDVSYDRQLLALMVGLADAAAGAILEADDAIVIRAQTADDAAVPLPDADVIHAAATKGHAHLLDRPQLGDGAVRAPAIVVPVVARRGRSAVAILTLATAGTPFSRALALERLELLSAAHRAHMGVGGSAGGRGAGASVDVALVAALVGAGSPKLRARAFVDQLQKHLCLIGAPAASTVGLARVDGARVRLVALSGQSDMARTSTLVADLRAQITDAIGAAVDAAPAPGVSGQGDNGSGPAVRERRYARAVTSLVSSDGGVVGAITVTGLGVGTDVARIETELRRVADAIGPALLASERARTFAEHRAAFATDKRRSAWLIAAGCGAMVALALPMPERAAAPFRMEALEKRTITAPFDGQLDSVSVRVNDTVKAGTTVLAKMSTRELDLTLAANEAVRASALSERATAQQALKPAEAKAADLKAERAAADIAVTRFRKSLAEVKAPIDGIVVKADVQRQAGSVLSRGQVMFEIADPRTLVADILVPDEEIVRIAVGQTGVLSPAAEPGASYEFRIERIYPVAEAAGQRNVFRVRARFDGPVSDRLKPGMEGAARIRVGTAPVGWLMVRDMVEAVRRWLWV